jgi:ribosome-binding ATPase YchF (GTP1/OBG family)
MDKIGLVGFSSSGKSTVFRWLTGVAPDPARVQQGQTGMAKLPDPRLDRLSGMFKPKKTTPAEIAFLDTPGLDTAERRDNPRRLGVLRESNGLVVVLNGYSGGDLAKELRHFREEIAFADLEIVTNRVSKIEANLRKPRPAKEKEIDLHEQAVLQRLIAALESGQPPAQIGLKPDEELAIRSFQLLTLKPEIVLVNQGDALVGQPLPVTLLALAPNALAAPARLEVELGELSPEDRETFAADLGITGSSRDATLRGIFAAMNRLVFFTVGEDECRAWPLPRGADAVEGAGSIHTDFAKRFVRAEVVGYEDFLRAGGMKEAKSLGVYRLEGKTYVVQDGDIMHILASS